MSQDAPSNEASSVRIAGVPTETFSGERRVALVPSNVATLKKAGIGVIIQSGAGAQAGYDDDEYAAAGAELNSDRNVLFERADIILQVRAAGANPDTGNEDRSRLRDGQTLIGMCDPLVGARAMQELAGRGVTSFALELLPRITRAQSMDVLSSQASIAGYKAVLAAAAQLPKMCPMMMMIPFIFFSSGCPVSEPPKWSCGRRNTKKNVIKSGIAANMSIELCQTWVRSQDSSGLLSLYCLFHPTAPICFFNQSEPKASFIAQ